MDWVLRSIPDNELLHLADILPTYYVLLFTSPVSFCKSLNNFDLRLGGLLITRKYLYVIYY